MSREHTLTLRYVQDLERTVAADILDRAVAGLTNDIALDSDDVDLVLVELSLSGIEVERYGIKTVGDLIQHVRPRLPPPSNELPI